MSASDIVNMSATEIPAKPLTSFTCNACKSIFENSASQRMHFKSDLHVTNVKRQVGSLSSVYLPIEETQTSDATGTSRRTRIPADSLTLDDASDDEVATPPIFNPLMCLFCVHHSSNFDDNLAHMQTAHGLSIPEQGRLVHPESFINYLFTIIFEFNECIYCGIMKGSVKGVQRHMLTKGHSKIRRPEKGSDYRDFYDFSDTEYESEVDTGTVDTKAGSIDRDNLVKSTEDFVRLSSGRTLGHRSTVRSSGRNSLQGHQEKSSRSQLTRNDDTTSASNIEVSEAHPRASGQQLMTRTNGDRSLVGVPEWQRRALRATEKKMLNVEIRARNRFEAAVQRAADQRADLRQRRVTRVADSV